MSIRRFLGITFAASLVLAAARPALHAAPPPTFTLAQIKLSGSLDEGPVPEDLPFGPVQENLRSKLDRIKKAKTDPRVQGLLLQIDDLEAGWGKLHELRQAIADFRKSGKKAYAYMESGNTRDYLLAVACDEIVLPESSWLMLTGMQAEVSFYKNLFEKIGVKADMLQMGDYKGAAEPFTRSSMSKPFRERLEAVLDDRYTHDLVGQIARSRSARGRKLTPEHVKKLIDQGPFTARAAAAAGLVDRVAYLDDLRAEIKKSTNAKQVKLAKDYAKKKPEEVDFSDLFSILKLFKPPKASRAKGPRIALIYATGVITTGKSVGDSLLGEETMGSTTMIEAIRKAEQDDTVKAIVLRVDSPGGSALASDLIWHELRKCKKPLIASMGDVAASGGYYISMAARKIYAEPGTLTGSIGVVGGKIVLGGLYNKVGLTTDVISRGANAGILSSTTPFSESQRKAMRALMMDVYDQFIDKAIQGRVQAGKKFKRVDFLKLAEGRVWTGRQAKVNGLVDEVGTLNDAIAEAKAMAGLTKTSPTDLLILPKPKSLFESLFGSSSDTRAPALSALRAMPELAGRLRPVAGLLRLRGEPVWAVLPCRIEMR